MISRRRALRTLFVLSTSAMSVACAYDFGDVPDSGPDNPPADAGFDRDAAIDATDDGFDSAMDAIVDAPPPPDVCQGTGCLPKDGPPTDTCASSCKMGPCCDAEVHDGPIDHNPPTDAFDACTGLMDGTYCGSELKGMFSAEALYACKGGILLLVQDCMDGCKAVSGMSMCVVLMSD